MRALALGALLAATPALAWDTWISTRHNWGSVYSSKFGGVGSYVAPYLDPKGNEHAEVSDHVLHTLSPDLGRLFGVHAEPACTTGCPQMPVMVDLNASFIRPELFGVDDLGNTQNPPTVLEERKFPRLAMWAGLPDFNYTVYDWINKSSRCPSLPHTADKYELCHVYRAWLGAGLNSTHMGTLNDKVYARIHATALKQAEHAGQMRKLFEEGGKSKTLPKEAVSWYADYTREAELMALTYEQVGQHFLHDRWSIGHMFSRWGPGSYEELNQGIARGKVSLDRVSSYGTLTGIVHGSLAVFGKPDPLSAPAINYALTNGPDEAKVMSFRYSLPNDIWLDPNTTRFNGLGDYLYKDVVDDLFDASVLHPRYQSIRKLKSPISVDTQYQQKGILTCGTAGLREVITRFAPNDGGYGEFAVKLPAPDANKVLAKPSGAPISPSDPICTDLWAANDSYYASARTIAGPTWLLGDGVFNDVVVAIGTAVEGEDHVVLPPSVRMEHGIPAIAPYTPPIQRVVVPLGRVMWRSWMNKKEDERKAKEKNVMVRYGTESAKRGFNFTDNGIHYRTNEQYGVPPFYEPEDLDALPWFKETRMSGKLPSGGKDRAAIDGFFNKARTETWCKMLYGNEKNDKKIAVTLKMLREKGLEYEIDGRRSIPTGAANAKRARAMCSYLANRIYKRTDEAYKPVNATRTEIIGEHLPLTGPGPKFGPSYEPVCAYLDPTMMTTNAKDDDKPYWLKPGYVGTPGEAGEWGYAPKSLEHWCSLIPVLEVGIIDDSPDVAGVILHDDGDRWLKLKGENLGIRPPSGKVGTLVATDKDGVKRTLDVFDPPTKAETGGWSSDNLVIQGRIPGSKNGFDTLSTAADRPDEIKNKAPKEYVLELTRPDDIQAPLYYRANGAKTVGLYKFQLFTSWVESANFTIVAGQKVKGVWATYPEWSRPQTTVLKDGIFQVAGGAYTEVPRAALEAMGITVDRREGQYPVTEADGTVSWVVDKNRIGTVYSHPIGLPSSVFNSTTSYFLAFH